MPYTLATIAGVLPGTAAVTTRPLGEFRCASVMDIGHPFPPSSTVVPTTTIDPDAMCGIGTNRVVTDDAGDLFVVLDGKVDQLSPA